MSAKILVVDDDPVLCRMLVDQLGRKGYAVRAASTLAQGLATAAADFADVVLLDVQMPDGNGLDFLPAFIACPSHPEVIIVTGHGAPDGAEKAIRGGAWSYIEKPHVIRDLPLHLTRALQFREEKTRVRSVPVALKRQHIIGDSKALLGCMDLLAQAAASDVSVLISGETGTGKEVFARAVHENSQRVKGNFVVVDCASLPEHLIESVLFGHERGAFTGADRSREGLIRHANGGTLFLDEVGELPLSMQKTFLRVLENQQYRPVGSAREEHSDFRLVAATNRDLEQMTAEGQFRSDLLFRLKGLTLHLPPLRERKEDIRSLVQYCMNRLCERYGQETKGLSADFIEALAMHDWPGNVRELFRTMDKVFAAAPAAPTLFCIHLPEDLRILLAQAGMQCRRLAPEMNRRAEDQPLSTWRDFKASSERQYVVRLMAASHGSVAEACRSSGLSRARLYQLLKQYDITSEKQ